MNVIVATPLGEGGQGGIDRIMDDVRRELAAHPVDGLDCSFIVTRGQRSAAFSAIQLPIAAASLIGRRIAGKADVVHINLSSHGSTSRKMLLASLCRTLGVPYLLHVHGSRMRQYWQGASPSRRKRIDTMFSKAARTLVLGGVWQRFVESQVPDAAPRVVILPNASRAARLPRTPSGGPPQILFLGRVGARKGVPELIDALAALPPELAWTALVAGDGEIDETRERVAALGLADKVSLPGWVGPADVEKLLAGADILVLPSHDENLPMSVIEAMANGLAVIATPVGATEEIVIDGETGLLVPPGDAPALAVALERLIGDAALREKLGAAALAMHRERLEITPYVARLVEIWRDTIAWPFPTQNSGEAVQA